MQKSHRIVLAGLTLVLLCAAAGTYFVLHRSTLESIETPRNIAFALPADQPPYTTLRGTPVSLTSDTAGKVVVAMAWASWCPTCVDELRMMSLVASTYSDMEVAFLAINRNDPRQTALQFLDRFQIGDVLTLVHDPSDHFFSALSSDAMPETIVFSRSGDIIARSNGPQSEATLKAAIERALVIE